MYYLMLYILFLMIYLLTAIG